MEKNFKLDDPDYYSMRFGLIVLQSDETIEQEMRSTLDESVAIYHSRIPCDQFVNNENLAKMENDLPIAVDLLPKIDFNSIGYACTSGATVIGSEKINKLIKALEDTFIIDENLTINKSAELLWSFRDFDITKVNKITTPTDYLTLQDGRQVLVLNQSLYNFLIKESIIDS